MWLGRDAGGGNYLKCLAVDFEMLFDNQGLPQVNAVDLRDGLAHTWQLKQAKICDEVLIRTITLASSNSDKSELRKMKKTLVTKHQPPP